MVRVLIAAAVCAACGAQSVSAQQPPKKEILLGDLMHGEPERRKNVILGIAEGLSGGYPNLRLSILTKCLEEAADMPANWRKDFRPFAIQCAKTASHP